MTNEFSVAKAIEDTARVLENAGMLAEDARRQAVEQVNSMGVTKTFTGACPVGGDNPMLCMLCQYGHITNCHYPYTCDEAKCAHYQAELEAEGGVFELDEDQARLFKEG